MRELWLFYWSSLILFSTTKSSLCWVSFSLDGSPPTVFLHSIEITIRRRLEKGTLVHGPRQRTIESREWEWNGKETSLCGEKTQKRGVRKKEVNESEEWCVVEKEEMNSRWTVGEQSVNNRWREARSYWQIESGSGKRSTEERQEPLTPANFHFVVFPCRFYFVSSSYHIRVLCVQQKGIKLTMTSNTYCPPRIRLHSSILKQTKQTHTVSSLTHTKHKVFYARRDWHTQNDNCVSQWLMPVMRRWLLMNYLSSKGAKGIPMAPFVCLVWLCPPSTFPPCLSLLQRIDVNTFWHAWQERQETQGDTRDEQVGDILMTRLRHPSLSHWKRGELKAVDAATTTVWLIVNSCKLRMRWKRWYELSFPHSFSLLINSLTCVDDDTVIHLWMGFARMK